MDHSMKKTAVITFVKNARMDTPRFNNDAQLFSLPYSKILDAQEFCFNEHLDHCFIGFNGSRWVLQVTRQDLDPAIKITTDGISAGTLSRYIIDIVEI